MTEKELEILFRKKFDERNVEFNPAAWKGAERLIIAGEKRRRRRAIVAWSSAATAALVVGLSVWGGLNTPRYQPINNQLIAWPTQTDTDADVSGIANAQTVDEATIIEPATSASSEVTTGGTPVQLSDAQIGSDIASAGDVNPAVADQVTSPSTTSSSLIVDVDDATLTSVERTEEAVNVSSLALSNIEVLTPELQVPSEEYQETTTASESAPIIQRPRHRVSSFAFGAEAGLNVSEVSNGQLGWKPAFYAGIPVEYAFAENMMLRSGLFYSQRAGHGMSESEEMIDYGFGRRTVTREYQNVLAGYLELPLSFGYNLGKNELEVGAYIGMRVLELSDVKSEESATLQTANVNNYLARRSNPSSELIDYSVRVGYAYRVDERWRITAQGTYGLMDTYDSDLSGLNRHVQLRLGVRYMLGL